MSGGDDSTRSGPRPAMEDVRTTRFSDVCGGTDELKRLLTEEPDGAGSAEGRVALGALVDDATYMLARMETRLREYQAFQDELGRLVEAAHQIGEPRLHDATREARTLQELLRCPKALAVEALPLEEVIERAEEIRQVANDMEGALRRHKDAAIAAGRAYLRLRGARGWDDAISLGGESRGEGASGDATCAAASEAAAALAVLPGVPEAWLPPAPHREVIVEWLRKGRATLLSDAEVATRPIGPQGREPLVQFEDGGVMPLRAVRWSSELKNFYPLGSTPHPRGRLYRRR